MKGYENVDVFESDEWDLILNKILLHYKDGKFKYDPDKSSQGDAHRSKKSGAKQAMLGALKVSNGKDIIKVAFNLLLDYCKQQDEPYYIKKLEQLMRENDKFKKQRNQLQREKDNRDANLDSHARLLFDKWKNEYVCEKEDVNKLNDDNKNLRVAISDKNDIIQELKQDLKDVRNNCSKQLSQKAMEFAELELACQDKPNVKKLKEEMKELKDKHKDEIKQLKEQLKQKPKENMDDNKEKFLKDKLKKILSENKKISSENLELKNRIVELEVDAM
jgi:hypothetical protein